MAQWRTMKEEDKADAFCEAVEGTVDRFRNEFDMTFVSMMGVLELVKVGLACEALGVAIDPEEDEEDGEGEEWKLDL